VGDTFRKSQCWAPCYSFEDNDFSQHLYADDTEVYGSCWPVEVDAFSTKFSECIGVVSNWKRSNRLQLNSDKTVVLWCTTGRSQHQLPTTAFSIDGVQVFPVTSVRNLHIFIDADLAMRKMFNEQYRDASLCFVNCVRSATRCRRLRSNHWWSLWC